MLKQYRVLSNCLKVLKSSQLQPIQELKIEVQLIRAKRLLLLDDVFLRVKDNVNSEAQFDSLFRLLDEVCREGGRSTELENLNRLLDQVLGTLKQHSENEDPGGWRVANC